MRSPFRILLSAALLVAVIALPGVTSADTDDPNFATFDRTKNMHPLGSSSRDVPFSGVGSGVFNSDLAFSGKTVIQGHYAGFRIIDVSDPEAPVEIVNYTDCVSPTSANGSQGDVIVHGDILIRSWDAPRGAAQPRNCGEIVTPPNQEGVHVFDISDPTSPVAVAFVALPCGSHTATAVPDSANDRLLIYNSASSAACTGIDIVEVPLDLPSAASLLRFEPSGVLGALPNVVTINSGPATGTYQASEAAFGPTPTAGGISGDVVLVNDGAGPSTSDGCEPFALPAGSIALVDRGNCTFVIKAQNAQAAGASAVIVANNAAGTPGTLGGDDPSITIPSVMVSLADGNAIKSGLPATGTVKRNPAPAARQCHDTGVILGSVMRAACAGGNGLTVWSMHPADGGSLEDPVVLFSRPFPGVTIGHSASFSWDGEIVVFGHEPGGGGQARCQATSAEVDRTLFFLDADTGATLGTLIHPRPQGPTENCTWHNYNVVPTDKRHILVSGSYQAGISVVEFTDPANPKEIAFADPAPLSESSLVVGGDWSTYWYNGLIYQSDIRRGLLIWNLADHRVAGAKKFSSLNPQTQETSFAFKGTAFGKK
jgi:hypothetical protein